MEECGPIERNGEIFICDVPPPLCRCRGTEFRCLEILITRCRCSHYREQKVREKKPGNTEQTASLGSDCENVLAICVCFDVWIMVVGFCEYMSVCPYVCLCVYLSICGSN